MTILQDSYKEFRPQTMAWFLLRIQALPVGGHVGALWLGDLGVELIALALTALHPEL